MTHRRNPLDTDDIEVMGYEDHAELEFALQL